MNRNKIPADRIPQILAEIETAYHELWALDGDDNCVVLKFPHYMEHFLARWALGENYISTTKVRLNSAGEPYFLFMNMGGTFDSPDDNIHVFLRRWSYYSDNIQTRYTIPVFRTDAIILPPENTYDL